MLLKINSRLKLTTFSFIRVQTIRLILTYLFLQSSSLLYGQEYTIFIRNYEDKLYFVSIDSVRQAIYPRWGFQIHKVQRYAKKLSVTNEQNKTKEIDLDTAIQDNMYYEVFMKDSSLEIKRSNRTWSVKNINSEPFVLFKPSAYRLSKIPGKKLCEMHFNTMDLIFLKASHLPTDEARLEFLLKNIGKYCLRVENIHFFSQLFQSEEIKLGWLQSIYLQTVDKENFRNLSYIFKTPIYKENFHIWLNLITDK